MGSQRLGPPRTIDPLGVNFYEAIPDLAGQPAGVTWDDRGGHPDYPVQCGCCGRTLFNLWPTRPRSRPWVAAAWLTSSDGTDGRYIAVRCLATGCQAGDVLVDLNALCLSREVIVTSLRPGAARGAKRRRGAAPRKIMPVIIGTGPHADQYPERVWRPSKPASSPAPTAP